MAPGRRGSLWSPTSLEGLGSFDTRIERDEESREVHVQCEREAVQDIDCRVELLALNPSDIGPIDGGIDGEVLLRDSALDPDPPEVCRDACTAVHGEHARCCCASNHRIYSSQWNGIVLIDQGGGGSLPDGVGMGTKCGRGPPLSGQPSMELRDEQAA